MREPEVRELYVEAFKRSSFAAMMNYYRANYPAGANAAPASSNGRPKRTVQAPRPCSPG